MQTSNRLSICLLGLAASFLTACSDNDTEVSVSESSINIREDSNYFSGENVYDWRAPGGVARLTLEVDDFNHGDLRITVFDAIGLKIFDKLYKTADWVYYIDGDYYDVEFTSIGAAGVWTIILDYSEFTGEVDLTIEDLDLVEPDPLIPPPTDASPLLDPTFGLDGRATFAPDTTRGRRVVVDTAGRLVAVGTLVDSIGVRRLAVWRYLTDGTLDTTFASGGLFRLDSFEQSAGLDLSLDSANGILVSGWTSAAGGATTDAAVLRLTDAGALDSGFGSGGIASFDDGVDEAAFAVAADSAGRVLIAGSTRNLGSEASNMFVGRFSASGGLDPSFGTGGVFRSANTDEFGFDLAVDGSDRATVVGVQGDATAIWRLSIAGELDAGFGSAGVVTSVPATGGFRIARSITIRADGSIAATGVQFTDTGTDPITLAAWRYQSDGSPLTQFGPGGLREYEFNGGFATGSDVAFDASGRLLVCGVTRDRIDSSNAAATLWRFSDAGQLDTTLAGSDASGASRFDARTGSVVTGASALAAAPGGEFVVTGGVADRETRAVDLVLWRVRP